MEWCSGLAGLMFIPCHLSVHSMPASKTAAVHYLLNPMQGTLCAHNLTPLSSPVHMKLFQVMFRSSMGYRKLRANLCPSSLGSAVGPPCTHCAAHWREGDCSPNPHPFNSALSQCQGLPNVLCQLTPQWEVQMQMYSWDLWCADVNKCEIFKNGANNLVYTIDNYKTNIWHIIWDALAFEIP